MAKRNPMPKNHKTDTQMPYGLDLTSGSAALASWFRVTLPVLAPSPKKMTSTVKSSRYRRENGLGSVSRALS